MLYRSCVLVLLALTPYQAMAATLSGTDFPRAHLGVGIGQKFFSGVEWKRVSPQRRLSLQADLRLGHLPIWLDQEYAYTHADGSPLDNWTGEWTEHDGLMEGQSHEISLGLRHVFQLKRQPLEPWLGLGVVLIIAERKFDVGSAHPLPVAGTGVGPLYSAGVDLPLCTGWVLGLDLRFSSAHCHLTGETWNCEPLDYRADCGGSSLSFLIRHRLFD